MCGIKLLCIAVVLSLSLRPTISATMQHHKSKGAKPTHSPGTLSTQGYSLASTIPQSYHNEIDTTRHGNDLGSTVSKSYNKDSGTTTTQIYSQDPAMLTLTTEQEVVSFERNDSLHNKTRGHINKDKDNNLNATISTSQPEEESYIIIPLNKESAIKVIFIENFEKNGGVSIRNNTLNSDRKTRSEEKSFSSIYDMELPIRKREIKGSLNFSEVLSPEEEVCIEPMFTPSNIDQKEKENKQIRNELKTLSVYNILIPMRKRQVSTLHADLHQDIHNRVITDFDQQESTEVVDIEDDDKKLIFDLDLFLSKKEEENFRKFVERKGTNTLQNMESTTERVVDDGSSGDAKPISTEKPNVLKFETGILDKERHYLDLDAENMRNSRQFQAKMANRNPDKETQKSIYDMELPIRKREMYPPGSQNEVSLKAGNEKNNSLHKLLNHKNDLTQSDPKLNVTIFPEFLKPLFTTFLDGKPIKSQAEKGSSIQSDIDVHSKSEVPTPHPNYIETTSPINTLTRARGDYQESQKREKEIFSKSEVNTQAHKKTGQSTLQEENILNHDGYQNHHDKKPGKTTKMSQTVFT